MEKIRIRDRKIRIRDKHPGSETQFIWLCYRYYCYYLEFLNQALVFALVFGYAVHLYI
jgi:hypothetical protein